MKATRLEIAAAAKADLRHIQAFGNARYGKLQSTTYLSDMIDLFDLLGASPNISRPRFEFGREVRMHPYGAHVIFYSVKENTVMIERILSRYQNWSAQKF
jgi:toxin ParE1/3/4